MKRLFISQPMRGKTDSNILQVREAAIKAVEEMLGETVEAIPSFFQGAPAQATPMWYLGESIKLLGGADVVCFAPGWTEMRGCRIEHEVAKEYALDRIYL